MESEGTGTHLGGVKGVEISDILGLNKPLTKLVETVAAGVGALYRPRGMMKEAGAKAYEIRKVSGAIFDARQQLGQADFSNAGLILSAPPNNPASVKQLNSIEDRAQQRLSYQTVKEQINIEEIARLAADHIKNEPKVSDAAVDSDWVGRFFSTIGQVSNDQMQRLWAKVLAGEVRSPGSFSLRALEVLKNLSQQEAQEFEFIARFAIGVREQRDNFILSDQAVHETLGITHVLLTSLQNAGLIHPVKSVRHIEIDGIGNQYPIFYCNKIIFLGASDAAKPLTISCFRFTPEGNQLLELIPQYIDIVYITLLCNSLRSQTNKWEFGEVTQREGEYYHYCELVPVPGMSV